MVSGVMDSGASEYQLEAAISKVFASDNAWFVTDEAIQILAGNGYMKDYGIEKVMRDLRIFRIFEGTNDILRLFVALTGIQYAGGHLRELQKAVKDPISNFGVVFGEVAKRGKSSLGIGGSNALGDMVHPNLGDVAAQVCKNTEMFGNSVEKLLIKHGKHIIGEQFLLNRLAAAAIDIYATTCMLSRCTQSLNEGRASAMHEELVTRAWANEANMRIASNLGALKNPVQLDTFKMLSQISQNVCENNAPVQGNPLGI